MDALSLLASNAVYQEENHEEKHPTSQQLPQTDLAVKTEEKIEQQEEKPLYCICNTTYDQGFMICCDVCGLWCHGSCVGVDELHTKDSDNYVCPKCAPSQPSESKSGDDDDYEDASPKDRRRSSNRKRKIHNYSELNDGALSATAKPLKAATNFKVIMQEKIFSSDDIVRRMRGYELTKEFLGSEGFSCPTLIEDKSELQMIMPPPSFTVTDVRNLVGASRVLDVIECGTQAEMIPQWNLGEWTDYYTSPNRQRILNVISLEVTNTKLQDEIYSPKIVRDIDWIDTVWPSESLSWPKVQNYCLMSVRGAYTDFHIDFGGSSVWYHVLKGQKLFFFIPPTEENLVKYADWSTSLDQNEIFFADKVDKCYLTLLNPGQTLFIPTGWIHAVYTPEDSLVFGGNFLHGYNIRLQIRIYDIENQTGVPPKFRFPLYENMLWYAAEKYCKLLQEKIQLTPREIDGLNCLAYTLGSWISKKSSAKEIKEFVPDSISDPKKIIDDLNFAISELNMPHFQEEPKAWEKNAEKNPKSNVQNVILKLLEKQEAMRPSHPALKITLRLRRDPDEDDSDVSDDEMDDGALEAVDEDVYVPSRRSMTMPMDPDEYNPRRSSKKEKPKPKEKEKKPRVIKIKTKNGNATSTSNGSSHPHDPPASIPSSMADVPSPTKSGGRTKVPKPSSVRERLANKLKPGRGR